MPAQALLDSDARHASLVQMKLMKLNAVQRAGCAMFIVLFAAGVGVGVLATSLPAPAGDLRSVAGAMLGSTLTILGALYLFEHQRQQTRDSERELMKQLLQEILDEIAKVRAPDKIGDVEDYIPAVMMLTHVDRLKEKIATAKLARSWLTPDTVGAVRAFSQIELLSVDKEAINSDVRPAIMYGGIPDVEKHLRLLESRTNIAKIELDIE